MTSTYASAPAKIILLGEHFCVYGSPALSVAVDLRVNVSVSGRPERGLHISSGNLKVSGIFHQGKYVPEKGGVRGEVLLNPVRLAVDETLKYAKATSVGLDLNVNSSIPVSVGLGSSAALAVSTVTAVGLHQGLELSREDICRLSFASERFLHFNPSGVDQTTSTYGGLILYRKGEQFRRLKSGEPLYFLVGNTKVERSTGKIVKKVSLLAETQKQLMNKALISMETIIQKAVEALEKCSLTTFGRLMDENQALLSTIGVSHKKLDLFIEKAREAGALGAKLTGAGGGGCMVALIKPEKRWAVDEAIRRLGGETFIVKMDDDGVKAWKET